MSLKKFAFIAEGDVFTVWSIEPEAADNVEVATRVVAGLQSNPTVIDITDLAHLGIGLNWTFDGTNFIPPAE